MNAVLSTLWLLVFGAVSVGADNITYPSQKTDAFTCKDNRSLLNSSLLKCLDDDEMDADEKTSAPEKEDIRATDLEKARRDYDRQQREYEKFLEQSQEALQRANEANLLRQQRMQECEKHRWHIETQTNR